MGRSKVVARYEITPEIKELQSLAQRVKGIGVEVNIDITQDVVTINGFKKMTRAEAKEYILQALESNKTALTTADFPDQEEIEREEKRKAKLARKNRAPGSPPELKALIRRAKRIYTKSQMKAREEHSDEVNRTFSVNKAISYIKRKAANEEDQQKAEVAFSEWLSKGDN